MTTAPGESKRGITLLFIGLVLAVLLATRSEQDRAHETNRRPSRRVDFPFEMSDLEL